MGQRRGKKHTPSDHYVEEPDYESGDSPDNCHSHQEAIFKEQADGENKVADVAHPEHVAEFVDTPVMNALCEKEDQRQDAK